MCDAELVGKKFEEGNLQLDVKESFYQSEKTYSEKEAIEILQDMKKEDATFNIVGENAVKTAIEAGIINKEEIGTIQEIPYALVLL